MLLSCLLGAALAMAAPAPVLTVQNVITPGRSERIQSMQPIQPTQRLPAEKGMPSVDLPSLPSQADQDTAMQLYGSVGDSATDTALQAYQAAAKAKAQGYGLMAERELQTARHGVANVAIAKSELISGHALTHYPRNKNAAIAEFHDQMQQEEANARAQAGQAQDPAHQQFFTAMMEDLIRIEADPVRYSKPSGADILTDQ